MKLFSIVISTFSALILMGCSDSKVGSLNTEGSAPQISNATKNQQLNIKGPAELENREIVDGIIREISKTEVNVKNIRGTLGGETVALKESHVANEFKYELFKRRLYNNLLSVNPGIYGQTVKSFIKHKPLVAILDQKETGDPINILVANPVKCGIDIKFKAYLEESDMKEKLCIDDFNYSGGFSKKFKINVSLIEFTADGDFGEEVSFTWNTMIEDSITQHAKKKYIVENDLI